MDSDNYYIGSDHTSIIYKISNSFYQENIETKAHTTWNFNNNLNNKAQRICEEYLKIWMNKQPKQYINDKNKLEQSVQTWTSIIIDVSTTVYGKKTIYNEK